MMMMMIVWW